MSSATDQLETMLGPLETLLDVIPKIGTETEDTSGSFFDYAKAIANIGNPVTTFTGIGQKLHDVQNVLTGDFTHGTEALEEQRPVMDSISAAAHTMYENFRNGTKVTTDTEDATRHLTEAMRDQRIATLALADSFLGIIESARTLKDDQRELAELTRKNKEGTRAYNDAVLQVIEDQLALEDAILSYGKEQFEATGKTHAAERAIREAAEAAGIDKDEVHDLIDEIRDYIREINNVPSDKTTTFHVEFERGQRGGNYQHGGVVERTGMALVHKGEVFSGVNNEMGFGRGGPTINVTIGTVVGPGGVAEVADIIRRELQKTGTRNVNVGLS